MDAASNDMRTLKPGDSLRIVRRAAGLGLEVLDVTLLDADSIVEYVSPTWVRVRLPNGEEVEIHVSSLAIMPQQ